MVERTGLAFVVVGGLTLWPAFTAGVAVIGAVISRHDGFRSGEGAVSTRGLCSVVGSMTAGEALEIYGLLDSGGVRCWVMGGWGVDALLGFTTRSHKDLDLLVHRADIAEYCAITRGAGFGRKLEWEESRPVVVDDVVYDSAFVDAHADGREVDVHVVDIDDDGAVVQFHEGSWPLPGDTLSGKGTLLGRELRCVSRSAQLAMHSSYELPDRHRDDVRLLQDLAR